MKIDIVYDSYDNSKSENVGISYGRIIEGWNIFGHTVTNPLKPWRVYPNWSHGYFQQKAEQIVNSWCQNQNCIFYSLHTLTTHSRLVELTTFQLNAINMSKVSKYDKINIDGNHLLII